jgi:pyruvate ferredoxin oxidoreductase alpha subunit
MGSIGETAGEAVRLLREQGQKAGLVKLRLWRPFPLEDFLREIGSAQRLIVIDRALSPGGPGGGPVAGEIRAALYNRENRPQVFNFIAGLGGREVTVGSFQEMFVSSVSGKASGYQIFGVRG